MSKLSKWKKKVSAEEEAAVKKAMDEQAQNQRTYREVPAGIYSVVVDKMEVGESSWGDDQINISFKIVDGEFKNSRIFYNGTFDEHFSHGINATAKLLADMLDDGTIEASEIAVILGHGIDEAAEFLADAAEECESLSYDLDYDIQESKKTNPNTGKPYLNKYYAINDVYDL